MTYKIIIALWCIAFVQLAGAQQGDSINAFDSKGLRTGKWITKWKDTGKPSKVEYYRDGKKNGLCTYYDIDGRLKNEIEYVNDSIHGKFIFYSPTGQKEVAEFKNNRREGITRYYNYRDELTEEYEYHNNLRDGFWHIYSKSGRVIMESTFTKGRENGTRRTFSDNKKREILIESDFVNDKRLEKRLYKRGKLIKTIKENPETQEDIEKLY